MDWISLNSFLQLDEIVSESNKKPILIFKHSTRCAISKMALRQFEREFGLQDQMKTYFLDLLQYRDISNEIAQRFNVIHQSPQLLIIVNGKSIYNASHQDIEASKLHSVIS